MSWDISLISDGKSVKVDRHTEGGTESADLNITWNYSWFYYRFLDSEKGIRWLYGKTGAETIERLETAVKSLGIVQYKDYGAPTPGNAGYALSILLQWAKQHPDAIWEGD